MRVDGNSMRHLGTVALLALTTSFVLAVSNEMSRGQQQPACGAPAALEDGWSIATPESVGMDGTRLCGIAARLKLIDAEIHSGVVARRSKLVFEQYFSGLDQPWSEPAAHREFTATSLHDMRSAWESVVSLLGGIAIARKLIAGADEPVVKFFPQYAPVPAGWDAVTLRHLLTMSSGIQWDQMLPCSDPRNDEPPL